MGYEQRGQSLNSISAKDAGRLPASYWARRLGGGVAAADIAAVLDHSRREWHHTGRWAAATPFYSEDEVLESEAEIRAEAARRKAAQSAVEELDRVEAVWQEWSGSRRFGRWVERSYSGPAVRRGRWLVFPDGRRKDILGNRLSVRVEGRPGWHLDAIAAIERGGR